MPETTAKFTATKAHMSAAATLIMIPAAMFGVGDMPAPETLQEAAMLFIGDLVAAGISWLVTYWTANREKAGA